LRAAGFSRSFVYKGCKTAPHPKNDTDIDSASNASRNGFSGKHFPKAEAERGLVSRALGTRDLICKCTKQPDIEDNVYSALTSYETQKNSSQ